MLHHILKFKERNKKTEQRNWKRIIKVENIQVHSKNF